MIGAPRLKAWSSMRMGCFSVRTARSSSGRGAVSWRLACPWRRGCYVTYSPMMTTRGHSSLYAGQLARRLMMAICSGRNCSDCRCRSECWIATISRGSSALHRWPRQGSTLINSAANGEWGEPDTSSSSPNRREISRGVVIRGDGQAAYDRSVEYLGRSPLGAKILAQAEALGVVVNIIAGTPSDGGDKAVLEDDGTVHVNWSPRLGLTNGEAILSPALSLLHEFGHAIALIRDPSRVVVRLQQTMPDYGNAEEFRVISTIENPVAADLGEPIRHTHEPAKGELQTYVTTDDPTFHHGGVWR